MVTHNGQHNLRFPRLLLLLPILLAAAPLRFAVADLPPVQIGTFAQTELSDWLQGTLSGVYVEGGDLRLEEGQTSGSYESPPIRSPFGLNAAILEWHATVTKGQTITLSLRSSVDGQEWTEWREATARTAPGGRISQLFVVRPFTSWLQYRAVFETSAGSPSVADVTLTYLSSSAGPALVDIVGRVPPTGPVTATAPPPIIAPGDWGAVGTGREVERQRPDRVRLVEVRAPADDPNTAATLRALQWAALTLEQQDVLPYHFLVDGSGNIFAGAHSPTAVLPTNPDGAVAIGLLADVQAEGLSEAAAAALTRLLGWLGEAYTIEPVAVEVAVDAPPRLQELAPEIRAAMDRAIIRSQLFFAAGNTALGAERLSLFNRGQDEARVTLAVLSPLTPERRSVTVPAGQRVDLALNTAFPITGPLGLEIQADRPIEAERVQIAGHELLGGGSVAEPARAWYFGEGSTAEGEVTALEVLNPNQREVAGTLHVFPDGRSPISQTLTLAARSHQTVSFDQLLPDQRFGFKLVTNEPVIAERTIIAESGAAHLAAGVSALNRRWLFAEGSTMAGYRTRLVLLNPWPQQVAVTLHVSSEDGTPLDRRYALPPQSRQVITLNDIVPDLPFAMDLEAERPIAAERIINFDDGSAATASPGATAPATRWVFVEGSTAIPADEYLLVLNPSPQAVALDVAYTLPDGQVERHAYTVGAAARLTIAVDADVPDSPIVSTVITADRPIVAERTLYVDGVEGRGGETSLGIPGD